MKKLYWMFTLVLLSSMANAANQVDASTLLKRIEAGNGPYILDVRTPEEFAAGHVPGAVNIPHTQIRQSIKTLMPYQDKEVVVYCRSGYRAGIAEGILQSYGFKNIVTLEGHMMGWAEQQRPTE